MDDFTKQETAEALSAIASMIGRSERAREKFAPGSSRHTLLKNRIRALEIAAALIEKELDGRELPDEYPKEDLEKARAPIASLIGKSEKARQKLTPGSWQDTMLKKNLAALYIASPLLERALRPASGRTETCGGPR